MRIRKPGQRPPRKDGPIKPDVKPISFKLLSPHPAMLTDEALLKECEVSFGKSGGPGGQHRNKVETACDLKHVPSEVIASAGERRRQIENRSMALKRLRIKLAHKVRGPVDFRSFRPSELWESRRQGEKLSINPKHRDYPALLAEALDVVVARKYDVAGAAGMLGVTMSQLAKLIRHDKHAFSIVNRGRESRGMPALK